MRIIRGMCMMCGVSLSDGLSSEELRRRVGVEGIGTVLRHRLRWFGHVERKEDANWVKRCTNVLWAGPHPLADRARCGRAQCRMECHCCELIQGTPRTGPGGGRAIGRKQANLEQTGQRP